MGISNPSIGYSGFVANDITILSDPTEYSDSSGNWVKTQTIKIIEDIADNSTLRFKGEFYNAGGGLAANVRVQLDNSILFSKRTLSTSYTAYSEDSIISNWKRDINELTVWEMEEKVGASGIVRIKNFEICGSRSPVVQI